MHCKSTSQWNIYLLFLCISFVLGYSLGSFRCIIGSSFGIVQGPWEEIPFHRPTTCNITFAATTPPLSDLPSNHQKRDDPTSWWHALFENYVHELIQSTVELKDLSRANKASTRSDQELREQFRSALLKSLVTKENCNCPENNETMTARARTTTAVEREQLDGSHARKTTGPVAKPEKEVAAPFLRQRRIHASLNHFSGIGRIDRKDFNSIIDSGLPLFLNNPTARNDVMILYGPQRTLPDHDPDNGTVFSGSDNVIPAQEAVKNCRQLAIIHLKNNDRGNCWAFVPGQESFHIQKWLRVGREKHSQLNTTLPLRLVSRGYDRRSGSQYPNMPNTHDSKRHRLWLGEFLLHVDELLAEILPMIARIAVNKKVIFMITNAGQSTIFLNFVCAAKSRGLDISKILVFVLDKESKDLVERLGMAAYYNEKFFGVLPSTDGNYADDNFSMVVVAKIMAGYLMSLSGYDFLYQDVDIVWYKDPLKFFENSTLADPDFDIYFQDDVNLHIRFQPWRANSGFYFARSNGKTRMLMKDFLTKSDHLMASHSEQQTLVEVMSEHVSLWGLRVKVFDADDTNYFPCGGHYHLRPRFMKKIVKGELDDEVYMFHMNWNSNKTDKVAFMRQMGHWFVHDQCMDENKNKASSLLETSGGNSSTTAESCCSREALFRCHYRDKPSIKPCKDSPAHIADKPSWW